MTAGAKGAMNQSEFQEITCNLLKAREKSRLQGAIGFGFGFGFGWKTGVRFSSQSLSVIMFDNHLKTAPSIANSTRIKIIDKV